MDAQTARAIFSLPSKIRFGCRSVRGGRRGSRQRPVALHRGHPRGIKNLAVAHQESRSTLYNKARKTVCIAARIKGSDLHEYPVQWDHEIWSGLVQMLARDYPQRFEEVWLYTGPIYSENASGKTERFFCNRFRYHRQRRATSYQFPGTGQCKHTRFFDLLNHYFYHRAGDTIKAYSTARDRYPTEPEHMERVAHLVDLFALV